MEVNCVQTMGKTSAGRSIVFFPQSTELRLGNPINYCTSSERTCLWQGLTLYS